MSVLGSGATSTSHKTSKILQSLLLETGDEGMDARLQTVTGWLADQGTEIKIGDVPRCSTGVHDTIARLSANVLAWDAAEVSSGDTSSQKPYGNTEESQKVYVEFCFPLVEGRTCLQ